MDASSSSDDHVPKPLPTMRRGGAVFVLVTVFLDTLGLGLIMPIAPRLVASLLGGDIGAASHYFGLLVSLYALMQFLFSPVLGGLSDRFGRRPIILLSLFGAAASYVLSGFAPALSWLLAGRIISGITGASFSAATAYVADVTPPEKRSASFGLVGAVFGLGFIVGPALGGVLGEVWLRLPYFAAAGLNGLNLLYGFFVLPESLAPRDRRTFSFARANAFGSLKALSRHPIVSRLTGVMMCGFLAQWILISVWALHSQARFGWNMREVGISLMVVGIGNALVQGGLVRIVVPRLGERRALVVGVVMGVIGQAAMALANRGWLLLASIPLLSLASLSGPAVQAIISREVAPNEQGETQGALSSLNGIAAIAGPILGTTLLGRFGRPDSVPYIPGAAFFAGSLFNLAGLILTLRLFRTRHGRGDRRPHGSSGDSSDGPRIS